MESVWPGGYTPPAPTASKRPAAASSAAAKKPKVDADNIDAQALAIADKVRQIYGTCGFTVVCNTIIL